MIQRLLTPYEIELHYLTMNEERLEELILINRTRKVRQNIRESKERLLLLDKEYNSGETDERVLKIIRYKHWFGIDTVEMKKHKVYGSVTPTVRKQFEIIRNKYDYKIETA